MSEKSSASILEGFIAAAKSSNDLESTVELVNKIIESPMVHAFSELFEIPSIKSLENNPQYGKYFDLLKLFAYGDYQQYLAKQDSYPKLSSNAVMKLRHLTIVSLASKCRTIPYRTLCDHLAIDNIRELEDLIIEAFYADVIKGKLDQINNQLEIDFVIGRDVTDENIDEILGVLDDWCKNCEIALKTIETEVSNANIHKQKQLENQAKIENEVSNLKKTIKIQNQEVESINVGKDNLGAKKGGKMKSIRLGLGSSKTK